MKTRTALVLLCFGLLPGWFPAFADNSVPGVAAKAISLSCNATAAIENRIQKTDDDQTAINKILSQKGERFNRASTGMESCENIVVEWLQSNAASDAFIQCLNAIIEYLQFDPNPNAFPKEKLPPFL
jgi:hypothetical protein